MGLESTRQRMFCARTNGCWAVHLERGMTHCEDEGGGGGLRTIPKEYSLGAFGQSALSPNIPVRKYAHTRSHILCENTRMRVRTYSKSQTPVNWLGRASRQLTVGSSGVERA